MSLFSAELAAANSQLAEVFGDLVTLVRKSFAETTGVTAQVMQQMYVGEDDDGIGTTLISDDFVINMDDYKFADAVVTPRSGDQIKRTIDSTVYTYDVVSAPDGRCCVPDVDREEWLIHTTFIDP